MNRNIFLLILAFLTVAFVGTFITKNNQRGLPVSTQTSVTSYDFANQKFMLDEEEITFKDGLYQSPDSSYISHTASVTHESSNPAGTRGAAIIIDEPGGSGTFYYLVGAMLKDGPEFYSQPVALGDRIEIEAVTVDDPGPEDNGVITVQYLDRAATAPMSSEPTLSVTAKYAFQDDGNLIKVL